MQFQVYIYIHPSKHFQGRHRDELDEKDQGLVVKGISLNSKVGSVAQYKGERYEVGMKELWEAKTVCMEKHT